MCVCVCVHLREQNVCSCHLPFCNYTFLQVKTVNAVVQLVLRYPRVLPGAHDLQANTMQFKKKETKKKPPRISIFFFFLIIGIYAWTNGGVEPTIIIYESAERTRTSKRSRDGHENLSCRDPTTRGLLINKLIELCFVDLHNLPPQRKITKKIQAMSEKFRSDRIRFFRVTPINQTDEKFDGCIRITIDPD